MILNLGYDFPRWASSQTGRLSLYKRKLLSLHLFLALAFLLAACTHLPAATAPTVSVALTKAVASTQAAAVSASSTRLPPTRIPSLTPFLPATDTPPPPSPTPLPKVSLWLSPALPDEFKSHFITALNPAGGLPGAVTLVASPAPDSLHLDVALPGQADWQTLQSVSWVYALVAPFRTVLDGVTMGDLSSFWQGENNGPFGGQPLLLAASTLAAFQEVWGLPAAGAVRVLPAESLLSTAWDAPQAWAIVPFDALEPRWKVLTVDGLSPIQKDFQPQGYPLTLTFALQAPPGLDDRLPANRLASAVAAALPPSNRDPSKMTVLIMTGTTALTRATAYTMEMQGVTFPGRDIGAWLRSADLVHISNEVSFYSDCPFPNPNQVGLNSAADRLTSSSWKT